MAVAEKAEAVEVADPLAEAKAKATRVDTRGVVGSMEEPQEIWLTAAEVAVGTAQPALG